VNIGSSPVDGLTQEEPIFTLTQFHEKAFEGILKKGRNLVIIEKGAKSDFTYKRNKECTPQNVFTITGRSIDDMLNLIEMHSDEIVKTIRNTEIAEVQRRNAKAGLLDEKLIPQQFGISIKTPATYKQALKNDSFLWLKKDIPGGNASLLIYTVPVNVVERHKTINDNLIKMRDSIGNMYIHGQEPGTFMLTEEAYSPYIFPTSFNESRAFEMRGNWQMESDMSGPFINYTIMDNKRNRYLVIEGFIYSPSSPKRDLLLELESIIKSLELK